MIVRLAMLLFALGAYGAGLAATLYFIGFIGDIAVPKSVNDGAIGPIWLAVLVNLTLIGAFGLHHSATARSWFKRRWTRVVAPPLERAVYLYMAAAATALFVWLWRPIPITLWRVEDPLAAGALWTLFGAVWLMMFAATFHFGHFGFMGLAQAWRAFRGRPEPESRFSAHGLYALVRHPISVGWILAPWLTPHMTVGLLVFALGVLAYILAATPWEEADLTAELGADYHAYKARTPAFTPSFGGKNLTQASPFESAEGDRSRAHDPGRPEDGAGQ